jgi:hypothetical protein
MNSSLYPIHLPLSEGNYALVYVRPDKEYNQILGSQLVELYGRKTRVVKPKPIPLYKLNVSKKPRKDIQEHLNVSEEVNFVLHLSPILPKSINIKGRAYDPKELIVIIEDIEKSKLFSRRNNRPLKTAVNTSYGVRGFISEDSLMILGRRGVTYTIRGKDG